MFVGYAAIALFLAASLPTAAVASERMVALNDANFDAIALDPSRNVLVQFTAPFCPYCAKIAPAIDRLAEAMSPHSDFVVAFINAQESRDTIRRLGVHGYPMLRLYPKGEGKDAINFDGNLESHQALIRFARHHAKLDTPIDDAKVEEGTRRIDALEAERRAASERLVAERAELARKMAAAAATAGSGGGEGQQTTEHACSCPSATEGGEGAAEGSNADNSDAKPTAAGSDAVAIGDKEEIVVVEEDSDTDEDGESRAPTAASPSASIPDAADEDDDETEEEAAERLRQRSKKATATDDEL